MSLPFMYQLSETAVTVAWEPEMSPEIHAGVMELDAVIASDPFPGWIENVPAYNTLTVHVDPLLTRDPVDALKGYIGKMDGRPTRQGRLHRIPVRYDPALAPDLIAAAGLLGLSVDELVQIHSGTVYRVYMIGFMPGFPYMGKLDKKLVLPRKAVPARRVPAGAVAIAGWQTGIYPFASPGGWHVIGSTDVPLFQGGSSLLEPGDEVEFYPVKK